MAALIGLPCPNKDLRDFPLYSAVADLDIILTIIVIVFYHETKLGEADYIHFEGIPHHVAEVVRLDYLLLTETQT